MARSAQQLLPPLNNPGAASSPGRGLEDSQALLEFLKEQAEREEKKERQAVARKEERERAAAARADRYLYLFEKLVNKF